MLSSDSAGPPTADQQALIPYRYGILIYIAIQDTDYHQATSPWVGTLLGFFTRQPFLVNKSIRIGVVGLIAPKW